VKTTKKSAAAWTCVLGTALVLSTALVGCTGGYDPRDRTSEIESTYPTHRLRTSADQNGRTLPQHEQQRTAGLDTIMGRNANPNMVIGHGDVANGGTDARNMEMMAKSVPGVEQARVTLVGGNAYVSLDMMPNVTAQQARSIEEQVVRALYQKVPRYDFHITSNDGYHR